MREKSILIWKIHKTFTPYHFQNVLSNTVYIDSNKSINHAQFERSKPKIRIEQLFSLTIYNNNTLINLDVTKSILLFGPSGSGKTHIIHELSDKFNVKLITITIGDLSSEFPLELEKGLDQYFSMCSKNQPS
ncbi:5679_t:CDS:2, partial [Entrophospora sp. SA101]